MSSTGGVTKGTTVPVPVSGLSIRLLYLLTKKALVNNANLSLLARKYGGTFTVSSESTQVALGTPAR